MKKLEIRQCVKRPRRLDISAAVELVYTSDIGEELAVSFASNGGTVLDIDKDLLFDQQVKLVIKAEIHLGIHIRFVGKAEGTFFVSMSGTQTLQHSDCPIEVVHVVSTLDADTTATEFENRHAGRIAKKLEQLDPKAVVEEELGPAPQLLEDLDGHLMARDDSTSSVNTSSIQEPELLHALLDDGTVIIAEPFFHDSEERYRQIQVRISMETLLGHNFNAFSDRARQGLAAPPLSILSGWRTTTLTIDQDYNADGLFEKGHLLRGACGAPYNSLIICPMFQYINKKGGWHAMEGEVSRLLCSADKRSVNRDHPRGNEQVLATLLWCRGRMEDSSDHLWNIYLKIRLLYKGPDPRVPSKLIVTMHRQHDRSLLASWAVDHTLEAMNAEVLAAVMQPSDKLCAAFKAMEARLAQADSEVKAVSKFGPIEWEPIAWGDGLPPAGLPEAHVPRPYRVLDFIQVSGFAVQIAGTLNGEEKEIFEGAMAATVGRSLPFSSEQRQLAALYNRYRNQGNFLSDLAGDAWKSIPLRAKDYQDWLGLPLDKVINIYNDPIKTELSSWGGDSQAHADHHVPSSTGTGYNLLTNLLYVSKKQNLRSEAQTKPMSVTNPILHHSRGTASGATTSTQQKKKAETTNKEKVLKSCQELEPMKRSELAALYKDRWLAERVVIDPRHVAAAYQSWRAFLDQGGAIEDVPWCERYKQEKAQLSKFRF